MSQMNPKELSLTTLHSRSVPIQFQFWFLYKSDLRISTTVKL